MIPNEQKIPSTLKKLDQWILWKTILRSEKPSKVPFRIDGSTASSTDPSHWSAFDSVLKKTDGYEGIGFVFSATDNLVGIDFDGCREPITGMLADWAKDWIAKLNSYSEISPSETGVKVWVKAKSPLSSGRKIRPPGIEKICDKEPGIEVYDHSRYFTVTGRRYSNLPAEPQERQKEVEELCRHFFSEGAGLVARAEKQNSRLSVIERARKYVERIPGAIAGQAGHDSTYHVACILILGFGLTKGEAAPLLLDYNRRCEPRWSDKELQHKLDDADKEDGERGYLRDAGEKELDSIKVPQYKQPAPPPPSDKPVFERIGESQYRLSVPALAITLEVDRLRREHSELIGELSVKCNVAGVRTYDGSLSVADFNLSGARSRTDRAKLLDRKAGVEGIEWESYLEELCQRVIMAEREGNPSIDLRSLPKPEPDDNLQVDQIKLPRRHPAILFGDGGSAKSYIGLYIAGQLAKNGIPTALFDWELAGEDHRDRLERIYNHIAMPHIEYVQCKSPLVDEMDRLRKVVQDKGIEYAIFDSITFACDGPPESAETAARYYRAVRQIGCGSLHIAHITKSEFGDQKPFGSVFWHNGARSTFFAKLVDPDDNANSVKIGIFNRKCNLGRIQRTVGYEIVFDRDRTWFQKFDPLGSPELAEKMPIRWRLTQLLKEGPLDIEAASREVDADADSVRRTLRRYKNQFVIIGGTKVALKQQVPDTDTLSTDTLGHSGGQCPPL